MLAIAGVFAHGAAGELLICHTVGARLILQLPVLNYIYLQLEGLMDFWCGCNAARAAKITAPVDRYGWVPVRHQ
jgi:hypothetical protein